MYEKLKNLKYYHPDDEGGELFAAICNLCYKFSSFSDDRAEILYGWAKDLAEESKKWCEEEGYDLNNYMTGM